MTTGPSLGSLGFYAKWAAGPKDQVDAADPGSGKSAWSLSFAKVVAVDPDGHHVKLKTMAGEKFEHPHLPVPINYPGAGPRTFLGCIPSEGDYCIVGWSTPDSSGMGSGAGTKTPVIISWVIPGPWLGRGWYPAQEFGPKEQDVASPKAEALLKGHSKRIRYKLRHADPGNIIASSSQGADLILDEGVRLANRRANEIILRDQDQAIMMRSLNQFHAMAGSRVYGGLVQRDTNTLPTRIVSDGLYHAAPRQLEGAGVTNPIPGYGLPEDLLFPEGGLNTAGKPYAQVMSYDPDTQEALGMQGPILSTIPDDLNPYKFLQAGFHLDEGGSVVNPLSEWPGYQAKYNGKNIYRISNPTGVDIDDANIPNSWIGGITETLAEYRIEVNHTSKGELPVTEQTDGYEVDRVDGDPQPFVEVVYGSVVGNDAFSAAGRSNYALPLRPIIFGSPDAVSENPGMIPALGEDIGDHAATLFRVNSRQLTDEDIPSSFWSVTKDGKFRSYISGGVGNRSNTNAVEVAIGGRARIKSANAFNFISGRGFSFNAEGSPAGTGVGFSVATKEGVVLSASGVIKGGGDIPEAPSTDGTETSVRISGDKNVEIISKKKIVLNAPKFEFVGGSFPIRCPSGNVQIEAGGSTQIKTQKKEEIIQDSHTTEMAGPKNMNPQNLPVCSHSITTASPIGVVDVRKQLNGDRSTEITLVGTDKTKATIGNVDNETRVGACSLKATANSLKVDFVKGIDAKAAIGTATMKASTGAAKVSGLVDAALTSTAGAARISGQAGVYIGGGSTSIADTVVGALAAKCPLTGLPMAIYPGWGPVGGHPQVVMGPHTG